MDYSFFDRERRVLLKASKLEQEGRELLQVGANKKALVHLQKALACLDEDVSRIVRRQGECSAIYSGLSDSFLVLGQSDEAQRATDMALQLDPDNGGAWRCRARLLAGQGNNTEALDCFDRALKINPGDKEVWSDKGEFLLSIAQPEDAAACF